MTTLDTLIFYSVLHKLVQILVSNWCILYVSHTWRKTCALYSSAVQSLFYSTGVHMHVISQNKKYDVLKILFNETSNQN